MKKTATYIFLFLVFAVAANGQNRTQYIEKYKDAAIAEMKYSGIPASITLAQACLESANGTSRLAVKGNNHFGIKCHNWKGKTIAIDDDAKGECFRKYNNADESFRDHSDFLRYKDRYAFLFELEPTDYKGWAFGLKNAGYATDPNYAARLIKIIEDNKLYIYDKDVAADMLPPAPAVIERPVTVSFSISLGRNIMSRNNVEYIVANGGETFSSLASELNLFKREILRFNDLKTDGEIQAGTIVYIETKRKEAARHFDKHVVEAGETIWSISQRFAVREKYLRQYNNLKAGEEPAEGTIIRLRRQ